MRCSIAIFFTCMLVFHCPIGKGGRTCETWNNRTNSKILGGPRQTRMIHVEEGWQEVQSCLIRGRGHDGCIPEVLQEDSRSSMYTVEYIWCNMCLKEKGNWNVMCHLYYITYAWLIPMIVCCLQLCYFYWFFIFRRLKINHDSYEFILELGTIASSSNIWKCIEYAVNRAVFQVLQGKQSRINYMLPWERI